MKFNIDKKTGFLLTIILALAASLFISMNSSDNDEDMHNHMMNTDSSISNKNYTGADIMFLQMMIPHHQQAIDMSNLALKISKNAELLDLAEVIIRDQTAEIIQMKQWLKDAGAGTDPGHEMSGMGGMLTEEEFKNLETATGGEFDKLWLEGMTKHHDGAIHMTTMINDAQNMSIKNFGMNVVNVQSAQIEQMKVMIQRIKG